jgi:hypothetical protein
MQHSKPKLWEQSINQQSETGQNKLARKKTRHGDNQREKNA